MRWRPSGRHAEALSSYEQALNLRPGYAVAWSNRGLALAALGRLEEAVASYDVALQIDDDGGVTHYNRANVLRSLGRHEEALAGYAQASALNILVIGSRAIFSLDHIAARIIRYF
mgnify:CR=1 FL=1